MKKHTIKAAAAALAVSAVASVQAGTLSYSPKETVSYLEDSGLSIDLTVTSDTFFGVVPAAFASYTINEMVDFTAYGLFWGAGTGLNWGNWTEFGFGLNFKPTPYIDINPQVGFLGGSLLSSAALGPGVLGDGWVPNVTANLDTDQWEGEIYFGAYLPIRNPTFPVPGVGTLSFLHYWANFGYKANDVVSFGGHFEQLTGGANATAATIYTWVGPYIQLRNEDKGLFFRVAGGWDASGWAANSSDTFYKMTVGLSF